MAIDPVSGNVIPPGASAEEVRDDVDIKASENEYVIPADVVRFLGLDKIEKLVTSAKEKLAELSDRGRIGGDTGEDDDELPFDTSGLESIDDEPVPDATPAFAEGGQVKGNTTGLPQDEGFSGIKTFKKGDKTYYIPYANGRPLFDPPSGATEVSMEEATSANTPPQQSQTQPRQNFSSSYKSEDSNEDQDGEPRSRLAGDPSNWTPQDFINFGKQKDDFGSKAIKGMIGFAMPPAGLLMKQREKMLNNRTAEMFDTMLETGQDLQGNTLTSQQVSELGATRDRIKEDLSKQSGLNLTPFGKLKDAVTNFTDFIGGVRGTPEGMVGGPAARPNSQSSNAPRTGNATDTPGNPGPGSPEYEEYYGNWQNSDSGRDRDNDYGPSRSTLDSGGNISTQSAPPSRPAGYGKGGLIKRRAKKK